VRYTAVQYSTLRCSAVQCSAVQCNMRIAKHGIQKWNNCQEVYLLIILTVVLLHTTHYESSSLEVELEVEDAVEVDFLERGEFAKR
jgi:hypothetical protein